MTDAGHWWDLWAGSTKVSGDLGEMLRVRNLLRIFGEATRRARCAVLAKFVFDESGATRCGPENVNKA